MKYKFNVAPEKPRIILPTNLIPKALEAAKKIQPDPSIQPMWEGQIFRDIEANKPSHWKRFINALANEARAVLP